MGSIVELLDVIITATLITAIAMVDIPEKLLFDYRLPVNRNINIKPLYRKLPALFKFIR